MKKLVVSALFVSVFFIGISGLISGVSAKFSSVENAEISQDGKALELIRAARIALGGNQNLTAVKSMTVKAATTHFSDKNGVQDVKQGSLEINLELPGKFSKKVMIGSPADGGVDAIIEKDVDVIVQNGDGGMSGHKDGKENVFIIRKGDAKDVDWTEDKSSDGTVQKSRIKIKKPDGTVEEVDGGEKHKFIVRTGSDGTGISENIVDTDGNKRVRVEKRGGVGGESNEMLRMTIGLLMTAPDDGSVNYKFLGQGSVDGFPSNIIAVESKGSMFKLYLDAGSNLPQMISYEGMGPHRVIVRKGSETVEERIVGPDVAGAAGSGERQVKFSDFRSVGNLLLPYRWTEMSNGKVTQNIDITGYEINPANIAEKFGSGNEGETGRKVIIRKHKN